MKKLKVLSVILGLTLILPILSACNAFSSYRKFQIEYTKDMEFLVGEDYFDSNLKGYGILSSGAKEDVTKKMTVDSSKYKKNVIGTYEITCKFEDFEVSYTVKVVNRITNLTLINERLNDLVKNSFKCDASGKLNYEAYNTTYIEGHKFDEYLIYSENNGEISACLKWSFDNSVVKKFWFEGKQNFGKIKCELADGNSWQKSGKKIDDFNTALEEAGTIYPITISLYSPEYYFSIDEGQAILSIDSSDNYNVDITIQGFEFNIQYKNNVIKNWLGVIYNFGDDIIGEQPELPEEEPETPEEPELPGDNEEDDIEELEITYTQGLQFLIGEDFSDPLLKGTVIHEDGSEEDVTNEMVIDLSQFNKNEAGKYEIVCKFDGMETSYEVEVVAELTDNTIIAQRLETVFNETCKRTEGILSYTASNSSVLLADPQDVESSYVFDENLVYVDNNEQLSIYLSWSINQEKVVEYWYEGTFENAILTLKGYEIVEAYPNATFEDFIALIFMVDELSPEFDVSVFPLDFESADFSESNFVTLTRSTDGVYNLVVEEGGENIAIEYKDNVITSIDGINYTFPKPETSIIPEIPEVDDDSDDDSDDDNETVPSNIELNFSSSDADLVVKVYTRTNNVSAWQDCGTITIQAGDTESLPTIVLLDEDYNFGNMVDGDFVEIKFEIINTGSANLSLGLKHTSFFKGDVNETYKIDDGNYTEFPWGAESVETSVGSSQTITVYVKLECDGFRGGCCGGYIWTISSEN